MMGGQYTQKRCICTVRIQLNLNKGECMKQLNVVETSLVSGGDFDLTMTMHVPSSVAPQLTGLIQMIVTGQIADTNGFANALAGAGPILNEVRVDSISFSDFN